MTRHEIHHLLQIATLTIIATAFISTDTNADDQVPQSCTCLMITDGKTILGGGNEDQDALPARAWLIPASDGKYGRLYFGFEGIVESGMNDQGLFYDSLSVHASDVPAEEGKELHKGIWTLRALETCATVEEVVAFIDEINIPGTWTDQLIFGDRTGKSIIVEGKQIIRTARHFQVCTNFSQTRTAPDEITCDRYRTVEQMLGEMEVVSLDAVRDIFAATAAEDEEGGGTAYTAIFNPKDLHADFYFRRDFDHPIKFDLRTALAKGPHVIQLAEAAQPHRRQVKWALEAQAELERKINARIDRTIDLTAAPADLIGHYAVDPAIGGIVPIPPVMLEAVSIVWAEDQPLLVVAPEGIYFDLRPSTEKDLWFHANVSGKPEMDVELHRDDAGKVVGATLTLVGLGNIPLVKVSNTPVYEPLPSTKLPIGNAKSAQQQPDS